LIVRKFILWAGAATALAWAIGYASVGFDAPVQANAGLDQRVFEESVKSAELRAFAIGQARLVEHVRRIAVRLQAENDHLRRVNDNLRFRGHHGGL
jgi:hypothetical protein